MAGDVTPEFNESKDLLQRAAGEAGAGSYYLRAINILFGAGRALTA